MARPVCDILMYHSISNAGGPTSIAPDTFRAQMDAIAEADVPVVSLDQVEAAWNSGASLPPYSIAITFDDGFSDFSEFAFPLIAGHGWTATVFIPTAHVGGVELWRGANDPARPLMSWAAIRDVASAGAAIGGHSVTHTDLMSLAPVALEAEVRGCSEEIMAGLGEKPKHFAPPYGRADATALQTVRRYFNTSCGTEMGRSRPGSDVFNLPRLEMFYFTDIARWRAHLAGKGAAYYHVRKSLRLVRDAVSKPWSRQ